MFRYPSNSRATLHRLIIRPGAIGDCILALPAMEHLAAAARSELWVPAAVTPLIRFGEKVRAISSTGLDLLGVGDLPCPPALVSCLRSFDQIVSWYGANRPEFRAAMQALGASFDFHRALPPTDYRGHATDFFSEQVGAPAGATPRIQAADVTPRDSVVIQPFSGSRRKNWPLELFRQLASALPARTEWCAGPEDTLSEAVRFDDLGELATWLSGAQLYIGNDSGITHLAAATGMPVLAIFLTTDPATWAPRGNHITVLRNPTLEQVSREANRLLG